MPKIKNPDIDVSRFSYDPDTGVVTWLDGQCKGKPLGTVNAKGYLASTVQGKSVLVHRLAWRLLYGEWPTQAIDHENGIRSENTKANMRLATQAQNRRNSGIADANSTGAKGVSYDPRRPNPYRAMISGKEGTIHLGSFATLEEASARYDWMAIHLYGEFARINGLVPPVEPTIRHREKTSRYRGVKRVVRDGETLWNASIRRGGVLKDLGDFLTEDDAGLAYDAAAWTGPAFKRGGKIRAPNRFMESIMRLLGDEDLPVAVPVRIGG